MLIGTTFSVCPQCGGEVTLDDHMIDAHVDTSDSQEVHLVWNHPRCGLTDETPISVQDYKAALSHFRRRAGEDTPRVLSEADVILEEFKTNMIQVRTVEDMGISR